MRCLLVLLILFCCGIALAGEIHDAAKRGDVETLKRLVAGDTALLKAADEANFSMTPLHVAVSANQLEATRWLIAAGADVNARDARGASPLILAGKYAATAVWDLLIAAKANINATPKRQDLYPLLHQAVIYGDLAMITKLLDIGADIQVRSYADGRTALHIAAGMEDGTNIDQATGTWKHGGGMVDSKTGKPLLRPAREMILLLLQRGAQIEARNAVGETPLCHAVRNNQVANARLLLEKGANLYALDLFGRTPLFHARDADSVYFLIGKGVNANTYDVVKGLTPLQQTEFRAVKEALLACGARADFSGKPVRYPDDPRTDKIFTAAQAGDAGTVKALLAENSKLAKAFTSSGHTPLYWGLSPLHVATTPEVAVALIDAGADVNGANLGGYTPLHLAAYRGNTEVVKLLLARGASPNARTLEYDTPLHWAAQMGQVDCAAALLANKANSTLTNFFLLTPLERAQKKQPPDPAMLQLLVAAGKN